MSNFLYQILYYLNLETPEAWKELVHVLPNFFIMNLTLIVMALIMKYKGNYPKILEAFPFRYIFPMSESKWLIWLAFWFTSFYLVHYMAK